MTEKPGPFDLAEDRAIYDPAGPITLKRASETFYQDIDAEFDWSRGHVLIQEFAFDEPWPTWEVHPRGDELVYLLEGDVDFVLWVDGTEQLVRVKTPGTYVVVPRGVWHTARPRVPTKMLFFTPGEGTLNAAHPG